MVVILVQLAAGCLVPSHCGLSLSLIGQETYYGSVCDLSGTRTSRLPLGRAQLRGGEGAGDGVGCQGTGAAPELSRWVLV